MEYTAAEWKKLYKTSVEADGLGIEKYKGTEAEAVIPAKIGKKDVIRIGDGAFENSAIQSIVIEEGVKEIGNRAFFNCKQLKSISIPDSIVKIEPCAFSGCDALANENGEIIVNGKLYGVTYADRNSILNVDTLKCNQINGYGELPAILFSSKKTFELTPKEPDMSGALKKGDVVILGRFPQDQTFTSSPIEWKVLAIEGHKAVVITDKCLVNVPYNYVRKNIIWSKCSLRSWLNDVFFNFAFLPDEQEMIDDDFADRVFLLTSNQVMKYFPESYLCNAKATDYARLEGTGTSKDGSCSWWLRSPDRGNQADIVTGLNLKKYDFKKDDYSVVIRKGQVDVNNISIGVRPCLRLLIK